MFILIHILIYYKFPLIKIFKEYKQNLHNIYFVIIIENTYSLKRLSHINALF